MEHLKSEFHEYLNENGAVEIVGYSFFRDMILRGMEPQGYQQAFDEWLENRKIENLEKANTILNCYDNQSRFNRLKRLYDSGAVIPFVGAGMSIPCGYPSWTSFLYSILPDTRISQTEFDDLINSGQYEEAAQKIFDDMPHGCFLERFENEFDADKELAGPVQRLPHMFSSAIITTNFDNVIKYCYDNVGMSFEDTLLGADAQELQRALGENKRVLVKLHGNANSSRQRILTFTEYETHYKDEATLENVIEAISNRTLLFLGCSLAVDRTIQALTNIVQRKGVENVPRHYAFLQLTDDNERLDRRDALAAANIFPVWYTEDHDESIEALLEKLAEVP